MALATLICSAAIVLIGIWLDFFKEKKPTNQEELIAYKRKIKINVLSSILVFIGFFFSYGQFKEEKKEAVQKLQREFNNYKNLDTIKYVGLEANKAIGTIRKKTDSIVRSLDSLDYSLKKRSELMVNSLALLDTSFNRYIDSSKKKFFNLLTQSKKIQFPLPTQILLNFKIKWSVSDVDEKIIEFIKKEKPPLTGYIYSNRIEYLIDSSYEVYKELYLAFKKINLSFKVNNYSCKYSAVLWPETIQKPFTNLYHSYESNVFKSATFIYDAENNYITLYAQQCIFSLETVTNFESILDINHSVFNFEVNPEDGDVVRVLTRERNINYIPNCGPYSAHRNDEMDFKVNAFIKISFNGSFSTSYNLITNNNIEFQIRDFVLGHNEVENR